MEFYNPTTLQTLIDLKSSCSSLSLQLLPFTLILFYYYLLLYSCILLVNGLRAEKPCIKRICMYVSVL